MAVRSRGFLALVFTALSLVPYGAHLFALPNKIGMTEARYFIAQSIYQGWAWLAVVLIPAMVINVAFAFALRSDQPAEAMGVFPCQQRRAEFCRVLPGRAGECHSAALNVI